MASVVIDIASEFTGKKAFKQAETATDKLTKGVKNLASGLGIAFSVGAVLAFAKASVKAAASDSKAQAILATNLKNVGLAYAQIPVEQFINDMQKQTGILDDDLRPAFARLAQATGSIQKSQELMANAFDIASGSGVDFSTVVETLSQAYIGNTKGLKKLGINMTAAELKTASFNDIIAQLNKQFAGAGKAAIATYGGQMQLLTAAASDAQEVIGFALLNALKSISGNTDVKGLTDGISNLANATSLLIKLLAMPLENKGSWVNKLGDLIKSLPGFNETVKALAKTLGVQDIRTGYGQQSPAERKAAVAAAAAANKRAKELAALTKEQAKNAAAILKAKQLSLAIDKANLALGKGTAVFDLEAISLNAAQIAQTQALGKATSEAQLLAITGDIARLTVKQDILALEAAIASKDEAAILAATNKLNADLKILGTLQSQAVKLGDIEGILKSLKPKDLINLENLDIALAKIKAMMDLLCKINPNVPTTPNKPEPPDDPFKNLPTIPKLGGGESINAILEYSDAVTTLANVMADTLDQQNYQDYLSLIEFQKKLGDFGGYSTNMNSGAGYGAGNVTVTVVDRTSGLIEVVQDAVIQNNRYGNNLNFAGAIN
jgi:hypothetical protein